MPFYEVIYETGANGIAFAETDDELSEGLAEQHRRAVNGEVGGPSGQPAERIKRVLKYDRHPADYNLTGTMSNEDVTTTVANLLERRSIGGEVSVAEVKAAIDLAASPVLPLDESGPHDTSYRMAEQAELDNSVWGGDVA